MAGVNFRDESPMSINLSKEETIKTKVTDINYIPSYKIAESERQANEKERIAYYNDIQQRVANGEFNGKDGKDGEKGDAGADGKTPIKGVDYWTESDKSEMKTYCNSYIDGQLGTINEQLASLTEVK